MHSQIRLSFLKIKLKELLRSSIKLQFSNQPSWILKKFKTWFQVKCSILNVKMCGEPEIWF